MKGMIKAITRCRRPAATAGGRRRGRAQKRDGRGRFISSRGTNVIKMFRPKGRPSAATRHRRNRSKERSVNVNATIKKGRMKKETAENRYDRIVTEGFDMREIGIINNSGGVDLTVGEVQTGMVAHYGGKNRRGRHDITVKPEYAGDPESMTHETIHILQEEDSERPALDKRLRMRKPGGLSPEERSLKEAMTEAETIARVKEPRADVAAFYDTIDEDDPWPLKEQDVGTLKGGRNGSLKGGSVGVVHRLFDRLNISNYRHEGSRRTAKEQKDIMEKKK